jgi:hypothetical protein
MEEIVEKTPDQRPAAASAVRRCHALMPKTLAGISYRF